jgi:hypothetical protein
VVDSGDVFVFCLAEFSELLEVTGLVDLREHGRKLPAGPLAKICLPRHPQAVRPVHRTLCERIRSRLRDGRPRDQSS